MTCPRCGNTDEFTRYGDQVAATEEKLRGGEVTDTTVTAWGDREGPWRVVCGQCGHSWETDAETGEPA